MQPTQYTLAVTLPDDETLQSFYGAKDSPAVQFIEQFLAPGKPQLPLYLFGASGSATRGVHARRPMKSGVWPTLAP